MKKIIILMTLLVTIVSADIKWIDMFDAYDVAKKENKTLMVMLSQKGCPGCEYMTDIVFEDKAVMSEFNKNFLGVHLDVHEDFIPDKFKYFATPTFYFVNANEKILKTFVGAKKSKAFIKVLKELETKK